MNNNLILYDLVEKGNVLNSQAILNDISIAFEIPSNYYFDKSHTNIQEHYFRVIGYNSFVDIRILKKNKETYKKDLLELYKKFVFNEELANYRNHKVVEFEHDDTIYVIIYDGIYEYDLKSKCQRYSKEYFELYFIAYSFDNCNDNNYQNDRVQQNNYCILKNGYHVYDKYNINLIKENPQDTLRKLNQKSFTKYLKNNNKYDLELNNEYFKKYNEWKKVYEILSNIQIHSNTSNEDFCDVIE